MTGADGKISKMQERMLRRQKRAKEWAEFNSKKPDDKYEDPVDVAAITYAEANMGDFNAQDGQRLRRARGPASQCAEEAAADRAAGRVDPGAARWASTSASSR